eukprot:1475999-Pyramimonas_sp.AAC.2
MGELFRDGSCTTCVVPELNRAAWGMRLSIGLSGSWGVSPARCTSACRARAGKVVEGACDMYTDCANVRAEANRPLGDQMHSRGLARACSCTDNERRISSRLSA